VEARERNVLYYQLPAGPPAPFSNWRDTLTDRLTRAAVDARIARLRQGNFSDSRSIGGGASENRIDFGPGFRIYYAIANDVIILLNGGDKSTQVKDIKVALEYWADYKERTANAARTRLPGRSVRRSKKR